MDIWTEFLDEGNLTDRPGLSLDNCCSGISSLPLQGDKGSLDGVEAERELTNLAPGVRVWVTSHIRITEGLVDLLVSKGRRFIWFHLAHIQRAGSSR